MLADRSSRNIRGRIYLHGPFQTQCCLILRMLLAHRGPNAVCHTGSMPNMIGRAVGGTFGRNC